MCEQAYIEAESHCHSDSHHFQHGAVYLQSHYLKMMSIAKQKGMGIQTSGRRILIDVDPFTFRQFGARGYIYDLFHGFVNGSTNIITNVRVR